VKGKIVTNTLENLIWMFGFEKLLAGFSVGWFLLGIADYRTK